MDRVKKDTENASEKYAHQIAHSHDHRQGHDCGLNTRRPQQTISDTTRGFIKSPTLPLKCLQHRIWDRN